MQKLLFTTLTCLLTIQSANANDFFLGVDLAKTSLDISSGKKGSRDLIHDGSVDSEPLTIGFRGGFSNEKYRLYGVLGNGLTSEKNASFRNLEGKETINYGQLTANLDFFLPLTERFKLFAGPHLGWAFATIEIDSNLTSSDSAFVSGLAYGGQFGAIFDITESFSVETGYSHSWTTIDEEIHFFVTPKSGSSAPGFIAADVTIEQANQFYFAANYTF